MDEQVPKDHEDQSELQVPLEPLAKMVLTVKPESMEVQELMDQKEW